MATTIRISQRLSAGAATRSAVTGDVAEGMNLILLVRPRRRKAAYAADHQPPCPSGWRWLFALQGSERGLWD